MHEVDFFGNRPRLYCFFFIVADICKERKSEFLKPSDKQIHAVKFVVDSSSRLCYTFGLFC